MRATNENTKRSRRRYCIICVSLIVVVGSAVTNILMWEWASNVTAEYDRSVFAIRQQIQQRKLAEAEALAEQVRLERIADRERSDADDQVERMRWAKVIEESTTSMQHNVNAPAEIEAVRLTSLSPSSDVTELDASFWSFRRLSPVEPPQVTDAQWCRNPIDQFIFAKLQEAGLSPNPQAEPRTLGRRLWFDLIGLPPTSEEIDTFVESGDYEQLANQLMQNPGFGERWGRVWLDLARYADSNGIEEDEFRPNAYPYRDFVIWSMNTDLPFDRFVRWQIAGDELAPGNPLAVAATGFFTAAPYNTFLPQPSERCDELDNMVSTMGSTMLGLTLGCARCHDHKVDPIPMSEYYNLTAIFSKTSRHQSYLVSDGGKEYRRFFDPVDVRQKEINTMLRERIKNDRIDELEHFTEAEKDLIRLPIDPNNKEQARLLSLSERATLINDGHIEDDTEPLPRDRKRYDQLMAEIVELKKLLPTRPLTGLTLTGSDVAKTHVLDGGELDRKQQEVGPGFLAVVTTGQPQWDQEAWKTWDTTDSSGETPKPRSALARWMTDVEHGAGTLVARVIVNRLWQHHFGEGLVRTAGDFGAEGTKPSHPELLDWLANELIAHDWSLKHIHRIVITSATYRQNGTISEEKQRIDPMNRLVGRHAVQRITAEMMRDTMLFVSGNLNPNQYGPGVQPPIPRDAVFNTQADAEDTWPCDDDADRPAVWRRSVYVMLKRTVPVPMLRLFDAPDGNFACQSRKKTTVPTQALALWNAPFVTKQSERLADRLSEMTTDDTEQVRQLFMLTVSRTSTEQEIAAAVKFLEQPDTKNDPGKQQQRLAELCHVMFMSNEFSYIE